MVAPRAGAWIEALRAFKKGLSPSVAPRAGAWIEANTQAEVREVVQSLPVRERGLKRKAGEIIALVNGRSPCGSVD